MSTYKLGSGKTIRTNRSFVDDEGLQHARNWRQKYSPAALELFGIIEIPDPPKVIRILPLAKLKENRFKQVDSKSLEILATGFKHQSLTFGMSAVDQQRWAEMGVALALNILPLPMEVQAEDKTLLALADGAAALQFLSAYLIAREIGALIPGRQKKAAIAAAADKEALDLIVDDRIVPVEEKPEPEEESEPVEE